MSDYISKAAALDILLKEYNEKSLGESDQYIYGIINAMGFINSLPSAQPEETFEFGKWYDFKRGYVLETTTHSFRILKDMEVSSNE